MKTGAASTGGNPRRFWNGFINELVIPQCEPPPNVNILCYRLQSKGKRDKLNRLIAPDAGRNEDFYGKM